MTGATTQDLLDAVACAQAACGQYGVGSPEHLAAAEAVDEAWHQLAGGVTVKPAAPGRSTLTANQDAPRRALAERVDALRRALAEVMAWGTGGEGWREEARAALEQDDAGRGGHRG